MLARISRNFRPVALLGAAMALASLAGCAQIQARKQLEGVAKGWCETIRASQVVPVYPLTEDFYPGDVFLVRTSQAQQQDLWKRRGFLPLDDFRTRLKINNYSKMYFDGYWGTDFANVPHPRPTLDNAGPLPATGVPEDRRYTTNVDAPRVAFPSYSFQADSSSGLSLSVPVHGIPVGLNFLNADRAVGTIAIADAYTYGADPGEVLRELKAWAKDPEIRRQLSFAAQNSKQPVFLRAVTRVYLTGSISVTLTNSAAMGADVKAGASVGSGGDIDLLTASDEQRTNYQNLLTKLGTLASKPPVRIGGTLVPGAAVKFTSASRRLVSLTESFDTPLVVGYGGFDVAVSKDGELSQPVPTFQVIDGVLPAPEYLGNERSPAQVELVTYLKAVRSHLDANPEPDPTRTAAMIGKLCEGRTEPKFVQAAEAAKQIPTSADPTKATQKALSLFEQAVVAAAGDSGSEGPGYDEMIAMLRGWLGSR